ncbi:ABC transporter ATP-binding protein [Desertimonas flava]|uniref:ABC transporter ATP-binding protein n=1 Tax=Desertimonas flava TaxID=2064846 RepID=UPI000E340B7E|nr:ATP-binding cassette domain-containing protein [Desertimonas flava]
MATVVYTGVTHRYPGTERPAVDDLNLDIGDGEFLVLVGPSGCGKSTSLRMLAGLEAVEKGRILIDGTDVTRASPRARDVAMVFQSYALYPNMTVAENMGFALRNARVSKAETRERVLEAARMLELEDLLGRKPGKLSGGQRQRVAMGRAIVRRPKVFCMDEPLSNLDAKLRVSTRSQISSLQRRLGVTTVYVTHDQVEAMTMGDRVAVLKDGVLQQVDDPETLYDNPVNTFVAEFIGAPAMNLLTVGVANGAAAFDGVRLDVPTSNDSESVVIGIRPESWDVVGDDEPSAIEVPVELVEVVGAESFVYATPPGEGGAWRTRAEQLVVRVDRRVRMQPGERLRLVPRPNEVLFFSAVTGERL